MAITVVVLSAGDEARLTFDGTQRVVIGRGAGSDLRLPDASVSLRHASLRAQGSDFVVVDEDSTNGTFVGSVRVAPRTSRILRSGDRLRLGRVWLELRIDQAVVTRDVAGATRDIALALVAHALDSRGSDRTTKVQVVEGPDQGAELRLTDEGAPYLIGRGAHCALPLADADVSREHIRVERRARGVFLQDVGTKNGTWLGGAAIAPQEDVPWRPPTMVRMGKTVLALHEPLISALASIESAADEPMDTNGGNPGDAGDLRAAEGDAVRASSRGPSDHGPAAAGRAATPSVPARVKAPPQGVRASVGWSVTDALVMGAALCVLALSLAGLVWLLHG